MPAHVHAEAADLYPFQEIANNANNYSPATGFTGVTYAGAPSVQNTASVGGGGAHNNMQPVSVINFFIKT
jgi:microcystin-dependent protein